MRLRRREKFMLTGLAIFLAVTAVVLFGILPARQRLHSLDLLITKKEAELTRLLALQEQWNRISKARNRVLKQIKSRGRDFAIFSYLENLAQQSGLKNRIQYMRPLTITEDDTAEGFIKRGVEIRLKEVMIQSLVNYLYNIEYSDKLLKVESLRLKSVYTDPQFINATFQVVTYDLT